MIFGHGVDPNLGDAINVTVIATGIDMPADDISYEERKRIIDLESSKQIKIFDEELLKSEQNEMPVVPPKKENLTMERG